MTCGIEHTAGLYFEGLYRSDTELLAGAFHGSATIDGGWRIISKLFHCEAREQMP